MFPHLSYRVALVFRRLSAASKDFDPNLSERYYAAAEYLLDRIARS